MPQHTIKLQKNKVPHVLEGISYLVDIEGTAKVEYFPGDVSDDSENPDSINVLDCGLTITQFYATDGGKIDLPPVSFGGEQNFYLFFDETDPVLREKARQQTLEKVTRKKPQPKIVRKSISLDDTEDTDVLED